MTPDAFAYAKRCHTCQIQGVFIHQAQGHLLLELVFDETFVKPYHLELYHKPIQEFFMIKTSQRELIMMCIVIVDSMLKALTHTHTYHSILVDL